MRGFCFATLFLLLAGCATLGTEITETNNQIRMTHFSFSVPPGQGWHLSSLDDNAESAIFRKEVRPFVFQISIMRNAVLDPTKKTLSAKEVANDFRSREEWGMRMFGVSKGMYGLRDVVKGEEVIGSKKYYTMTYTTFKPQVSDLEQRAGLYVHFPKERDINWFLVAHFSEAGPAADLPDKSAKTDFLKVLETILVEHK